MIISKSIKQSSVLFMDIETIPVEEPTIQQVYVFNKRYSKIKHSDGDVIEGVLYREFQESAALYPEFGKIVCISIGYIERYQMESHLRVKSFCGPNESKLLEAFIEYFRDLANTKTNVSGHNIKKFDIPFIAKRCSILGVDLPKQFLYQGKKPWDLDHIIDAFEIWQHGDFRAKGSLDVLCGAYGIPSPKTDVDGSMVWELAARGKYNDIAVYCNGDVLASTRLFLKMQGHKADIEIYEILGQSREPTIV